MTEKIKPDRRATIVIKATALRDRPLDEAERSVLALFSDSWKSTFSKCGIKWEHSENLTETIDGMPVVLQCQARLNPETNAAALPIVLDALYELSSEVLHGDWRILATESVITRIDIDPESRGCMIGERHVPQYVKGYPHPAEGY